MKDNINRLARGNFIYNKPQMELSDKFIQEKVQTGKIIQKEFTITSQGFVKGLVYSTDSRVVVLENNFGGRNNTIKYSVDASFSNAGDVISGKFNIVSNLGEIQIDYDFEVTVQMYETSMGPAYNMFHFANLVQEAPVEAAKLFESEEFRKIFIQRDYQLNCIYDILKDSSDVNMAMEEFLVAVKKKSPITFELSETRKTFNAIDENIQEQFVISKNNWGYFVIDIESDAGFVDVLTTKLTEQNFTGNKAIVEYVINKNKLHAGLNLARIVVRSQSQTCVLEIEVHNNPMESVEKKEEKNALCSLTKEYLNYRMQKEDMADWLEHSNQIIDRVRGFAGDNVYYKLAQAQLYVMQGRAEEADWLLSSAKEVLEKDREENAELYCYYLYVDSLSKKDDEVTKKAINIVNNYYENGHDDWRMLWLLFYLDVARDKNQSIKLARIKDMYHLGHRSPIMYFEAMSIMNAQPVLVRVLNEFELQVLYFGCRYEIISEELAKYVCELIGNEKVAHPKYLKLLEELNRLYSDDEMLNVLVTHMVRNELTGQKYFDTYERGVLRKLRITRLYEFYMASIDKTQMPRLPKLVLMYFAYDTQMDYANKAYLLANVLTNEIDNKEVMNAYKAQIEQFAYEQMRLRHIDSNLVVIYRYICKNITITDENKDFLSRFVFAYKIVCFDDSIVNVIVKHKEFNVEVKYPVINNVAYIQMYTEDCTIAFEDFNGVRRRGNIRYEIEQVFKNKKILSQVMELGMQNINILIYLHEQDLKNEVYNECAYKNCLTILDCEMLDDEYRKSINSWLIEYYYNHDNKETFVDMYGQISGENLLVKDSIRLIELCIINGMYNEAYELIKKYGFLKVEHIRLFRLARYMIESNDIKQDDLLDRICAYLFISKKYDEEILKYISKNYNDSNENMYYAWKACESFDVEKQELGERLVSQMMFSCELSARLKEVFKDYYRNGAKNEVVKAYIGYNSYLYFVKMQKTDNTVYRIIERMLEENEYISEICKLALLKNYSSDVTIQLSDYQLKIAQKILDDSCEVNKIFEFFKKFYGVLNIPYNLIDKTIIEYRADPDARVEIHYAVGDTDEYKTEVMKCQAGGVFTKSFTFFYGDRVKYYFTQDRSDKMIKTEIHNIICSNCAADNVSNRFDYINEMLASREMHDMVTLKRLMETYCVKDYVVSQMFKPM